MENVKDAVRRAERQAYAVQTLLNLISSVNNVKKAISVTKIVHTYMKEMGFYYTSFNKQLVSKAVTNMQNKYK